MQRILILILAALCVVSCGRRRSAPSQDTAASDTRPRVFLPAIAPSGLSPEEQQRLVSGAKSLRTPDEVASYVWDYLDRQGR